MPRLLLVLLFIVLMGLLTSFAHAKDLTVHAKQAFVVIGLGESVRLEVPLGAKVHISDGSVVRSRIIDRTVVMTGRRTGRTTLRLLGKENNGDKTLVVTARKVATTVRQFQSILDSRRGLSLSFEALPTVTVTGELLRIDDWIDLVSVSRETGIPWRLEAKIFPLVRPVLVSKIENELRKLAWPGQRFSLSDKGPTLTGGTDSSSLTADQKLAVAVMGIQLETSAGLIELEPMVRTQIVIAEVRRTRSRSFGIEWPKFATAALSPTLRIPSEDLLASLHAMEDEGEGRILAMPTLLCRSGGEAKFLAGGEIPISLVSFRSAQIEWKKYGITLTVQPKADRLNRMKFQLATEVTTLDKANEIKGVPGILTNRIETQFNLNGPQTIVLSGLIKREDGEAASGLPLLRSIPILGSLFGSENFRKSLTELIIFVSPQVIIPDGGPPDEQD